MSVGLVLEGGAMRGMYTAAVLDIFLEKNIKIDGIISVSAGALFGINYLSKQKGRVIRYNKKYVQDKRYMGLNSLIKTGNIVNKEFSYYELPLKLDVFDNETFKKSTTRFYVTITNVETGKPEYVEIKDCIKQIETLRASSTMPFVSKIVELDEKKYLDGGISDSIPVEKCKSMGYDKIIVILTRPLEYRKKKNNELLTKIFYRKYPEFVKTVNTRYRNYNNTVEKIIDMERKKEIFVIRPSKTINIKRIEKDTEKLQEMYNLGIHDAKEKLEDLKNYLKD